METDLGILASYDFRSAFCKFALLGHRRMGFLPLGVQIAKKERIDIQMVDGRNLEELEKAILGLPFSGTYINSQ